MRLTSLVLTGALALAVLPAAAARADEPRPAPPAAGEPFTREEMAALRRRVPGWDVLERAVKDRIARNVARLRTMSPEERARVLDRARRLDRAEAVERAQFPSRLEQWRRLSKEAARDAREGGMLVRAAWAATRRSLPDDARRVVEALPEGERRALEMCAFRLLRERAIESILSRPLADASIGDDAPEALRRRFEEARAALVAAGGDRAPPLLRRRMARAVHDERIRRARARALSEAGPSPGETPPVERLVAELRAEFPEAFASVASALAEAAAKGPEGLLALCEAQAPGRRARALVEVFRAIERGRPFLATVGPEAVLRADALQATLLAALGVPPDQVAAFGLLRTPEERETALKQMEALRNLARPK
jgi:hypothetical protein